MSLMSLERESDISDIEKTSTCHRGALIFRRLCYPCNEWHLFANLFFYFPLAPLSKCHPERREGSVGINQCLSDSRRRIKKTPLRFSKTSATFPDFSSTIFNSWRSVVSRNYLLLCYYQLITATNGYYLLMAANCIKCILSDGYRWNLWRLFSYVTQLLQWFSFEYYQL